MQNSGPTEESDQPSPAQNDKTQTRRPSADGRPRKRVRLACEPCRGRKTRCDGGRPPCDTCRERRTECVYLPWRARASVTKEYIEQLELRNRDLERNLRSHLSGHDLPQDADCRYDVTIDLLPTIGDSNAGKSSTGSTILPKSQGSIHLEAPSHCPRDNNTASSLALDIGSPVGIGPSAAPTSGSLDLVANNVPEEEQPPEGWVEDDAGNLSDGAKTDLNRVDSYPDKPPGYFGESSVSTFLSTVRPLYATQRRSTSPHARRLPGSGSVSSDSPFERLVRHRHGAADLSDCLALPQRNIADRLVNAYFTYIDTILPFIQEPWFRAKYERTWLPTACDSSTKDTHDLSWLALLNLVFAFGCEYVNISRDQGLVSGARFFKRATTILFSQVFHSGNLETIQSLILTSHYLQSTNNLNKCWSIVGLCIRMAHGMGLHLDPSRWKIGHVEQELRRRLWWGCNIVDCMLSLRYGRPPFGIDKSPDVRLPTPIDSLYLSYDHTNEGQQSEDKARCQILLADIGLSRQIESIVRELYLDRQQRFNKNPSDQSDEEGGNFSAVGKLLSTVVRLDGNLLNWQDNLPRHLRPDANNADWKLQRQANILFSKTVAIRVLLHRESLLIFQRDPPEDDFQREMVILSARQCLSSARKLVHFYDSLRERKLVNMWFWDAQYLNIAVAALVSLQVMPSEAREVFAERESLDSDERVIKVGLGLLKDLASKSAMIWHYAENLERLMKESSREGQNPSCEGDVRRCCSRVPTGVGEALPTISAAGNYGTPSRNERNAHASLDGAQAFPTGNGSQMPVNHPAPPTTTTYVSIDPSADFFPIPRDFFLQGIQEVDDQILAVPWMDDQATRSQYPMPDSFTGGFGYPDADFGGFRFGS